MGRSKLAFTVVLILATSLLCSAQKKSDQSVTVVFKDGHQRTFSAGDVSRIDFKNDALVINRDGHQENIPVADILRMDFSSGGSKSLPLGRNHFIGKWEVGEGQGTSTFTVILDADGEAHKSIGASHGTWALVDGDARISWDDGWRDVIRKVGDKHEKFAYEPGKSLKDDPSNVTNARRVDAQSM